MIEENFYRCIPALNKECRKNNCYINGGYCEMTIHKEYTLKGLLEEIERLKKANKKLQRIANKNEVENFVLRGRLQEIREEIRMLESNCDIADYQAQKLFQILDKGGE